MRNLTRQRAEALFVLDREVARLVATLKRTGEYANTVFMFTSDNGYFLGEHRMRQGKIKPHEPSLRVPFVVAGRGIPHGERFDPVTTPGVTATIAELAGATPRMPYAEDGVSVRPVVHRRPRLVGPGRHRGARVRQRCSRRCPPLKAAGFHDARNTIGVRTAALEVRPLLRRRRRALRPRPRPQRAEERHRRPGLRRRPGRAAPSSGWTTRTASAPPAARRCRQNLRRVRPSRRDRHQHAVPRRAASLRLLALTRPPRWSRCGGALARAASNQRPRRRFGR